MCVFLLLDLVGVHFIIFSFITFLFGQMHLNISDIVVVTRRLLNIASYCDVKDAIATHTLLVAE